MYLEKDTIPCLIILKEHNQTKKSPDILGAFFIWLRTETPKHPKRKRGKKLVIQIYGNKNREAEKIYRNTYPLNNEHSENLKDSDTSRRSNGDYEEYHLFD